MLIKMTTSIVMTRMNSTRVRLRKKPSVGSSSVAPGLLTRSDESDDDCVVTATGPCDDCVVTSAGPCELLLDGLLLLLLGDSVGTLGVV